MRSPHDIIIKPLVTEASMDAMVDKKYAFKVDKKATKTEIKNAVQQIFNVKVAKVNTMNMLGKMRRMGANVGRKSSWKKAIVTLTEDSDSIEFFEGM